MASFAALLFNSSLYLVAALLVYFVFGSLLFNAAVPPFDWKNLVADSFPPIFMMRNWSHCHSAPPSVDLPAPPPRRTARGTYGQGSWSAQRRCARRGFDGSRSSRDRHRYRMEQMSTWGSSVRNQNKSMQRQSDARRSLSRRHGLLGTDPVRRLGLQLFKELLRLYFGRERSHLDALFWSCPGRLLEETGVVERGVRRQSRYGAPREWTWRQRLP